MVLKNFILLTGIIQQMDLGIATSVANIIVLGLIK